MKKFFSFNLVLNDQDQEVLSLEQRLKELQLQATNLLEKNKQEEKKIEDKEKHLEKLGKGWYYYFSRAY